MSLNNCDWFIIQLSKNINEFTKCDRLILRNKFDKDCVDLEKCLIMQSVRKRISDEAVRNKLDFVKIR